MAQKTKMVDGVEAEERAKQTDWARMKMMNNYWNFSLGQERKFLVSFSARRAMMENSPVNETWIIPPPFIIVMNFSSIYFGFCLMPYELCKQFRPSLHSEGRRKDRRKQKQSAAAWREKYESELMLFFMLPWFVLDDNKL